MNYITFKADLNNDKQIILKFWRQNHGDSLDYKYSWLYENNPAGKAHIWLLKDLDSNEVVGMTGLYPRKFSVKGVQYIAGIVGDFFVHKHHRSLGPAIKLQKCVVAGIKEGLVDFAYGYPNRLADPVMKRVGFEIIGNLSRFVKIIKTKEQFKKRKFNKTIAAIISPAVDFLLKVKSKKNRYTGNNSFVTRVVNTVDNQFDELWKERKCDHEIYGKRNKEYIDWKISNKPNNKNKIFIISDSEKNKILGYFVYSITDKAIEICDFILPKERTTQMFLVRNFVQHAEKSGAESLSIIALNNAYTKTKLNQLGFSLRKNTRNVLVLYSDEMRDVYPQITDKDSWLLLLGDEEA